MDGYLSKPIDPQRLFAAVEEGAEAPPDRARTGMVERPATFDEAALLHRVSDDGDLVVDLIGVFVSDCAARLGAIEAAMASQNAEEVGAAAHQLKGAAATISAVRLADAADLLERQVAGSGTAAADEAWHVVRLEASDVLDVLRHRLSPGTSHPVSRAS
jgi:HPt (histidine-containing phosphotransfer) domain-containing protein